jgi:hypothetical protein
LIRTLEFIAQNLGWRAVVPDFTPSYRLGHRRDRSERVKLIFEELLCLDPQPERIVMIGHSQVRYPNIFFFVVADFSLSLSLSLHSHSHSLFTLTLTLSSLWWFTTNYHSLTLFPGTTTVGWRRLSIGLHRSGGQSL